jgi:hypothetical protein
MATFEQELNVPAESFDRGFLFVEDKQRPRAVFVAALAHKCSSAIGQETFNQAIVRSRIGNVIADRNRHADMLAEHLKEIQEPALRGSQAKGLRGKEKGGSEPPFATSCEVAATPCARLQRRCSWD